MTVWKCPGCAEVQVRCVPDEAYKQPLKYGDSGRWEFNCRQCGELISVRVERRLHLMQNSCHVVTAEELSDRQAKEETAHA